MLLKESHLNSFPINYIWKLFPALYCLSLSSLLEYRTKIIHLRSQLHSLDSLKMASCASIVAQIYGKLICPFLAFSSTQKDPGGGHKKFPLLGAGTRQIISWACAKKYCWRRRQAVAGHSAQPGVAYGIRPHIHIQTHTHIQTYKESLGTGSQKFMAVVCRGQRTSLNVV